MTHPIGQHWRTHGRVFVFALLTGGVTPIAMGWTSQEQSTAAGGWGSSVYEGQPSQPNWGPQGYGYPQSVPTPQPRQRDNPWAVGPPGYAPPGSAVAPRPWSEAPAQDRERSPRQRDAQPPRSEPRSWEPQPGYGQGGYYGGYYGDGYYGAYPGYGPPYGGGYPGWGYEPYSGGGPWGGGWPGGWASPLWGMPFFGW